MLQLGTQHPQGDVYGFTKDSLKKSAFVSLETGIFCERKHQVLIHIKMKSFRRIPYFS